MYDGEPVRLGGAVPGGGKARRSKSSSDSKRVFRPGSFLKKRRVRDIDLDCIFLDESGFMKTTFLQTILPRNGVFMPSLAMDPEIQPDSTLPCGLKRDEALELMYRDIKPEDFEMLSKLDESVPKTNIVEHSLIDRLPKMSPKECGSEECGVCLAAWSAKDTSVAQLPCKHSFHIECIGKWLTTCKNACPLCSAPIEKNSSSTGTSTSDNVIKEQQHHARTAVVA